jgi:ethanolamine ammonia-lyase small subunit
MSEIDSGEPVLVSSAIGVTARAVSDQIASYISTQIADATAQLHVRNTPAPVAVLRQGRRRNPEHRAKFLSAHDRREDRKVHSRLALHAIYPWIGRF